jgi:cysteinyl-tRNA synthetase
VFPHHENEVAQSEAATGERFARYWLHVGLLERDGEKMSSSLGNFLTVAEALERYGPNVLRTFYLGAAYGTRQTYSAATLAEAEERWDRLARAYDRAVEACDSVDARATTTDDDLRGAVDDARGRFRAAMDDDLNVRGALAALSDLARATNRHVEAGAPFDYRGLRRAVETFDEFGGDVFGLQFGAETPGEADLAADLVERVLALRERAREAGDYDRADDLRDALADAGVEVEDGADGPTYRVSR